MNDMSEIMDITIRKGDYLVNRRIDGCCVVTSKIELDEDELYFIRTYAPQLSCFERRHHATFQPMFCVNPLEEGSNDQT